MKYWFSFTKNTAALTLSAAIGQAISFAGILAIARLYGPLEVGIFGLFTVAMSLCIFLATWRYEIAIVTANSIDEADDVAVLVICAGSAAMVVTALLLPGTALLPGLLRPAADTWKAIVAVPAALLLTSLTLAGSHLCTRERLFGRLALHQIVLPAAIVASQLSLHSTMEPLGPLIGGYLVGQVAGLFVLGRPLASAIARALHRPQLLNRLVWAGHRHRDHLTHTVPYSLVTQFYYQLPVILLNALHTTQSVGFFSMAFRTTCTPISLIPGSISQVFFPEMARDRHSLKSWQPRLLAIFAALGILLAPPVAFLLVSGPAFYSTVLGSDWATAGLFAQIMIVANMAVGLTAGYDRIFFILRRQRIALVIMGATTMVSFALMILAHRISGTPTGLTVGWTCGHLLLAAAWTSTVYRIAGFSLAPLLVQSLRTALTISIFAVGLHLIARHATDNPATWLIAPILLAFYALLLRRAVGEIKRSLIQTHDPPAGTR